jgi:predicted MPP superfamily phosphohydrolase
MGMGYTRAMGTAWLVAALLVVTLGWVGWVGVANTTALPVMREATLHEPALPKGSTPVRIALIADIHLGNRAMAPARLGAIVDQVNAAHPDLILLAGDFVTAKDMPAFADQARALTAPLKRLAAPLGVVAVLGNHDNAVAPALVSAALARAGILVLDNQAVRRGPFAIVGVGDRYSGHDNLPASLGDARKVEGFPILLTHSPDIVPDLPADQPLVLAGHTHCGQIVLPWIGSLASRDLGEHGRRLYNPRYRCGIIHDGVRTTVVTAGVGSGSVPIRIGAMPDWWLLTVEP